MTMNDDDLILYYYRDGLSDAQRRRIEADLARDASLRERYEQLCADLGRFDAPPAAAAPGDMVARWQDSIDRAARLERQKETRLEAAPTPEAAPTGRRRTATGTFHLPSFAWGSAVAAALVLGLGFYLARHPVTQPLPNGGLVDSGVSTERSALVAFERGLQVHLEQSNQQIVGLPADADAQCTVLIMRMVQENRLFEAAAERNGAQDLARVLRAFDPILMQLASQDISPAEARALQAQLTFELNVMLTKLGRNVSEQSDPI
jgi:hypothetical protein